MSEIRGAVVLCFGPFSTTWLSSATEVCGEDAVVDLRVAQLAGATLAAGSPSALANLSATLAPGAVARQRAEKPHLAEDAVMWLAAGERGLSSDFIFQHLTGVRTGGRIAWPHDRGDLQRCRDLLQQVPALAPLFREKMGAASPEWAALMPVWDSLCELADQGANQAVYKKIAQAVSSSHATAAAQA